MKFYLLKNNNSFKEILKFKIGIIGAGKVGSTIGKKLALKDHEITFGVRDPKKYQKLLTIDKIRVENILEVSQSLDILILTVPGAVAMETIAKMGNLNNKLILDVTNMTSMTELMKIAPNASFVKFLNTVGYNVMENPIFGDIKADAFLSGNNQQALDIATLLVTDLDFNPVIVGDSSMAVDLENLAKLWIKLSRKIGRNFSFKLISRNSE